MIKYYFAVGYYILLPNMEKFLHMNMHGYIAHAYRYIHHIPQAHTLRIFAHRHYMHSTYIHKYTYILHILHIICAYT